MTAAAGRIRTGNGVRGPVRAARGFTYVSVIILVAIIGLVAATTVRVGATMQRAQAERELLYIGEQFSDALKSYANATPQGQPQQPPTLKELLRDPRFPGTRRHLRKIFIDPMTGKAEWGVIYMGDKLGVLGVYSLSTAMPIKVGNFPMRFQAFEGKQKISDWVFTFNGQEPPPPGQLPAKPGAGNPMTGNPMTGNPATGATVPGKPAGTPTNTPTNTGPGTPTAPPPSPLTGQPATPPPEPPAEPEPPPEPEPEPAPEPPPEPAPEPQEPPPPPAEPAEPPNSK
ncbi:type II secretion system protein [Pseudoduganella chitinolytica]|uniref:Type II secretion system protein n=1 Tax=Pseudoduganella chitinolytica TaxID=34070 RepID=A0ABY8BMQ8_9BURK|nr:type II secretion system protein [Pseudoduganella chitinolytica]WEF35644.1 type II secretion system protein [Pseudoduganella chitinolytica]